MASFNYNHPRTDTEESEVEDMKPQKMEDTRSLDHVILQRMFEETILHAAKEGYYHINTVEHKLNVDELNNSQLPRVSKDILFSVKRINYISTPMSHLFNLIIQHFKGNTLTIASKGQIVVLNAENKIVGFINRSLVVNQMVPFQCQLFKTITDKLFNFEGINDSHGRIMDLGIVPTAYYLITDEINNVLAHNLRLSALCLIKDVLCSLFYTTSKNYRDNVKISLVGDKSSANQIRLNDVQIANVFRPQGNQPNLILLSKDTTTIDDDEDDFDDLQMPKKKEQLQKRSKNAQSKKSNRSNDQKRERNDQQVPQKSSFNERKSMATRLNGHRNVNSIPKQISDIDDL